MQQPAPRIPHSAPSTTLKARFRTPPSNDWIIAAVLFLLAAGLRVWGVHWSLPYVIHADEPHIVDAGVQIVKTGDLNPHWFVYPSLVIYFQAAIYKLNLLWGIWRGYYSGPDSLPDQNWLFALAPGLYEWGRTATAFAGAAVVAGTYGLGRVMFGRAAGLVAGLLLLTSPLHIEHSHYLMTDVPMGALGLATLAAAWQLVQRPRLGWAWAAGGLAGLCASAKYNGAYVALVPAIAWGLVGWRAWLARRDMNRPAGADPARFAFSPAGRTAVLQWAAVAGGMIGCAVLGFLIGTPFALLDWKYWLRGVVFEMGDYRPATNWNQMADSFNAYISGLWATDWVILAVAGVGTLALLADSLRRRWTATAAVQAVWLLLPFPLVYIVVMSRFLQVRERNLVILLPLLCLVGGYGVARLAEWLAARLSLAAPRLARHPAALAGLAGVLLMAEPGREMINFDRYLAGSDSRLDAAAWVQKELRAGRRVAVELHPLLFCAPAPWACPAPDVYAPLAPLTQHPPAWYAARGYDYVALAGKETALLEDPSVTGPRDPAQLASYLALPEVAHFAGEGTGGKGPPVYVLRVGSGLDGMAGVTHSGAQFGPVADLWGYAVAPLATAGDPYDPADPASATATRYRPGAAIGLALYWRARQDGAQAPPGNWTVAAHLSNAAGQVMAQVDVQPLSRGRLRPVRDWYANELVGGTYNIPLPPALPPGVYRLTVALYDAPTGPALPVNTPGAPSASDLDLGSITVTP